MLCGLLVACSPGTPSPESEPNEADRAHNRAPTSNEEESPNEAATIKDYSGRKCCGHRPTILGTPGDDRMTVNEPVRKVGIIVDGAGDDQIRTPDARGLYSTTCISTSEGR